MTLVNALLIAYVLVNGFGFYLMGIDKKRAIKGNYRISEKTLWLVALFGGAVGMTVGMRFFRHKTKHLHFKLGLPTLAFIHLAVITYSVNLII